MKSVGRVLLFGPAACVVFAAVALTQSSGTTWEHIQGLNIQANADGA